MKVQIYSKEALRELTQGEYLENTAVISFYTPRRAHRPEETRLALENLCDRVFYVGIPDLDRSVLPEYGYSEETYLKETHALAAFIHQAYRDGFDIICQCDYGQSRSAACAAAILQYYQGRGIDIFADDRYYPNQLVYHKVFDALEAYGKGMHADT